MQIRLLQIPVLRGCCPRFAGLFVVVLAMVLIQALPSQAYYDDTHYGVNYVLARMVGYTPEQAHRIASACLMIDYSRATEPEQYKNIAFGKEHSAQIPRVRFHAMMDDRRFPNCLSDRKEADLAEAEIANRAKELFSRATKSTSLNLGTFLHFHQDTYAHAGYSSWGGHWASAGAAWHGNLPLGPYCDWLASYDEGRHLGMMDTTIIHLKNFMRQCCPEQAEYCSKIERLKTVHKLLIDLRQANPRNPNLTNAGNFDPPVFGREPDKSKWDKVVALHTKADFTSYPSQSKQYILNTEGDPSTESDLDNYVLWGDLTLNFFVNVAPRSPDAEVSIVLKPTRPGEEAHTLYRKHVNTFSQPIKFTRVPVGDISVEVRGNDIETVKQSVSVMGRARAVSLTISAKPKIEAQVKVEPMRGHTNDCFLLKAAYQVLGLKEAKTADVRQTVRLEGPQPMTLVDKSETISPVNPTREFSWKFTPTKPGMYRLSFDFADVSIGNERGSVAFEVEKAPPPTLTVDASVTPPSVRLGTSVTLKVAYDVTNLKVGRTTSVSEQIWVSSPSARTAVSNCSRTVDGGSPRGGARWPFKPLMSGPLSLNYRLECEGTKYEGSVPFSVTTAPASTGTAPADGSYWLYGTAYPVQFSQRNASFARANWPIIKGSVSGDTVTLIVDYRPKIDIVDQAILKRVSPTEYRGTAQAILQRGVKPSYPVRVPKTLILQHR